ncbi:MAG: prepilin-type N-terminal cleavage/methylation domain-containing protein [bacterium]
MSARARIGFTLLEAIVALAIVSIVSIGVLAAQGTALRAESIANVRLPLAALAQDRMTTVDLFDGRLENLPDTIADGSFAPPLAAAQWHVRAAPVRSARGLWTVTVVVRNGTDSVLLTSRRYRP